MTDERAKILDKAKKLRELANRGVGGEMENAKVMLVNYMEKHNITEEELNGHEYSRHTNLSNMSDDEFIRELIKDFIPIGIGVIFARFGNPEIKAFTASQTKTFADKFMTELLNRANKINKNK